jgi:hypothetical protein
MNKNKEWYTVFISPAIAALLLTFLTVIQIVDCLGRIGTDPPLLLPFLVSLLSILISSWLWLRFFRSPYKITISRGQRIIKSPIRTVTRRVSQSSVFYSEVDDASEILSSHFLDTIMWYMPWAMP